MGVSSSLVCVWVGAVEMEGREMGVGGVCSDAALDEAVWVCFAPAPLPKGCGCATLPL